MESCLNNIKGESYELAVNLFSQVMVLEVFDIHPAKESEKKIVDWERTYFLTKYYML